MRKFRTHIDTVSLSHAKGWWAYKPSHSKDRNGLAALKMTLMQCLHVSFMEYNINGI